MKNRPTKPHADNVNGILLLDKPAGMTSNGVLQVVKRLFVAKKAGHTGSLDPAATGMLPICFGEATKLCQFLLEANKNYLVTVRLGMRTSTGDADGEVIETRPVENVTQERLNQVLQKFIGTIEQIPPMYSAVKINGKALYKLARRGIEIERPSRRVTISQLNLLDFNENTFRLDVHCTKGTYVRSLADDIGQVLQCGAHVAQLRRVSVLPYDDCPMYTLDQLTAMHAEHGLTTLRRSLLPIETSAKNFPSIKLSSAAAFYLRMGHPVMTGQIKTEGFIRIFADDGSFMGIGEMMDDGRVTPRRLINYPKRIA
jgi:tRNA pseudouridine55 synthase